MNTNRPETGSNEYKRLGAPIQSSAKITPKPPAHGFFTQLAYLGAWISTGLAFAFMIFGVIGMIDAQGDPAGMVAASMAFAYGAGMFLPAAFFGVLADNSRKLS
jgi:hypothetical protein